MEFTTGQTLIVVEQGITYPDAPEKGDKVTVRQIRLYERLGWFVSLEEHPPEIFYPVANFKALDYDFVDDILKKL